MRESYSERIERMDRNMPEPPLDPPDAYDDEYDREDDNDYMAHLFDHRWLIRQYWAREEDDD